MSREITPSRKRVLQALLKYGPMISLRPFPGSRRGFQSRVQWFLIDHGYIENKKIPMHGTVIPHYYLTDKGRAELGLGPAKSLRETLNDYMFLRASGQELEAAIRALPAYFTDEDKMDTLANLLHTAKMVLDRMESDR